MPAQNRKINLKTVMWNCNSVMGKIGQLRVFARKHQYDVIGIIESRLLKKIPPNIEGYDYIFKNRDANHPAGGLIMYIKSNLEFEEIITDTQNIESLGIKIGGKKLVLVYVRTNIGNFDRDLDSLINGNNEITIMGDFNARHTTWNNPNNNGRGLSLLNYVERNNLEVVAPTECTRIANIPGHTDSTIDIAIAKNMDVELETINDLNSDHLPVEVNIRNIGTTLIPQRTTLDYSRADWDLFQQNLKNNIRINRDLNTIQKIDDAILEVTTSIKTAMREFIPQNETRNSSLPHNIQQIIAERNRQRNVYKRTRSQWDLQILQDLNQQIMVLIKSLDEHKWHQKIRRIEQNKDNVWKQIKHAKRNRQTTNIPPLKENNLIISGNQEKADLLNQTLTGINIQTRDMSDQRTIRVVNQEYTNFIRNQFPVPNEDLTNPFEVRKIIKAMRPFKAPGEDGIVPKVLKKVPLKTITQIHYIYNACLKIQYFPTTWKNSHVITLKKPGKDPTNPKNYRPISLTNSLSKILEHLMHRRIRNTLEANNTIIQEQFGFVRNKSTTLQLARIIDSAMRSSNIKYSTAMVLLDIEKAYDTIWRRGLVYKMNRINIPQYLTKLTDSYLNNRTIQVKVKDKLANKLFTEEGLPQGSVIAPTLFNIYINDIPKNNSTKIAMFADDTAIFSTSVREDQAKIYIQRHLHQLETYFNRWKLRINVDKTQFTIFNHKHNRNHNINNRISMYNTPIEETDTVKYLGITLDRKLTFKQHIETIRKRARIAKSLIYSYIQITNPLSKKLKVRLYKAYIRSIILYAAPIWSQAANYLISRLETLERNTLRTILGKSSREINNDQLYQEINITPIRETILEVSRKFFRIKTQLDPFTSDIGSVTKHNANFRKIHKLITDAID